MNKIEILGEDINCAIAEYKVFAGKYFIRVIMDSYGFEDVNVFYYGKKGAKVIQNVLNDSVDIWIEVSEKKFKTLLKRRL